jgi:hypothetical protein
MAQVNRGIASADFPIGKSPTRVESVDPLTIGVWGFELHVNCVPEFHDTAKPDFPTSKGRSWQELLWVVKTPERELEESLTLQACVKEGPGESRLDREGCDKCTKWYQSRRRVLFVLVAERSRTHHAASKRKAVT